MSSAQVTCPNCGALIPAEDINIAHMVAKCAECDHVVSLSHLGVEAKAAQEKKPPEQPSRLQLRVGEQGDLVIEQSWFTPQVYGLLFFCILWDGFLVFWYVIAATKFAQGEDFEWMMVLFPLLHVAVGVGLTYCVFASFFNKTRYMVDLDRLIVSHSPVPWPGGKTIERSEVIGFEVDFSYNKNYVPTYCLSAHVGGGDLKTLAWGIDYDQANFLLYSLSDFWGVDSVWRGKDQENRVPKWLRWLNQNRG